MILLQNFGYIVKNFNINTSVSVDGTDAPDEVINHGLIIILRG